jgi:hypothetical protein
MKMRYLLVGVAAAILSSPAMANILPGSGDTVVGSSIHDGFDSSVAAGNLINGTYNQAYPNGDPRWVFADGSSADENLVVDLGSIKSVDYAGFAYNGQDRIPTSFSVLTSTDDSTFTLIAGPSITTPADYGLPGIYTTAYSFVPSSAQYVEFDFGVYSINDGFGGGYNQGAGIYQLFIQDAQAVPEPLTLSLFGAGLAGVAAMRRRKKTNKA